MKKIILCMVLGMLLLTALKSNLWANGLVALKDPNWKNGEEIEYIEHFVKGKGVEVATMTCRIDWIEKKERSFYQINCISNQEESQYLFERPNIRLVSAKTVEKDNKGKAISTAEMNFKQDTVEVKLPNIEKSIKTEGNLYVLEEESSIFALRAFPFNEKKGLKVIMIVDKATAYATKVVSAGEETIKTSLGNLECYKLKFDFGWPLSIFAPKIYMWYAKEAPHYLVKFESSEGETIEIKNATVQVHSSEVHGSRLEDNRAINREP